MDSTDLAFAGAAAQARLIADGEVTSRELVEVMLDRIARIDPQINAYRVVLGAQALAEADDADARRAAALTPTGRLRKGAQAPGILNGVPVAIKDDCDVAGEVTAWGTSAHGPAKTQDAEAVRMLREAGAVIIGKTNVPEMTAYPWTESLTFGATRNPWDLDRTPGGSSGGTASAVAAGLAGVGLGSDGAGSIRMPSAWTGLFGIKPQRDRVSVAPHADAWQGMSVNGPIARTVADAALFLDATTTLPSPDGGFVGAAQSERTGLRIALSTKLPPGALMSPLGPDQRRALDETAALLRELGHTVVERDPDYPASVWPAANVRVMRGVHDDVTASMPNRHRLERCTRRIAWLGSQIPENVVAKVRAAEAEQTARIASIFDEVDVLMTPMATDGPYRVGENHGRGIAAFLIEAPRRLAYAPAWNLTGLPACSVPAGFDVDGLPVGVQFVAPYAAEERLFAIAGQIERARPWAGHRPPVG